MDRIAKRSIVVDGRKTSVSLESEFWVALREVAKTHQMPLASLVVQIKKLHPKNNLSSAIRRFLLNYYCTRLEECRSAVPAAKSASAVKSKTDGAGSDGHAV